MTLPNKFNPNKLSLLEIQLKAENKKNQDFHLATLYSIINKMRKYQIYAKLFSHASQPEKAICERDCFWAGIPVR